MKLHLGRGRKGGNGASIRSQKISLILRPRGFTWKRIDLSRWSGCLKNAISVVSAVEHREIHNVLSVRRVTADEDPLLQEDLFERFSDWDPEGFPLTYPAWHKNSINKKTNQRVTRWGNGLTLTTRKCMKQTRHNESVLSKFV